MVHVRLNEKEPNPNPHVNFINSLPVEDASLQERSRQLLRALAAQVKPVMKAHGFIVNSLEEYEHNSVFAGRNWNNGEVVEIVLRGPTGAYYPISWLISTLCHELAHIKHMNHGPAFQALWAQLRQEVRGLQSRGYYGDGYWSSGIRLADSAVIGGRSTDPGALPEYMCGGAQSRRRPTSFHPHNQGDQPATRRKKRKAGARVLGSGTFKGEGHALNADMDDDNKKKGTGFRKKANSKRAREERAQAAEKRAKDLLGTVGESGPSSETPSGGSDSEPADEETDQDRRRAMLDTMSQADIDIFKSSQITYLDEFFLPLQQHAGPSNTDPQSARISHDRYDLSKPSVVVANKARGKGKGPLRQPIPDSIIDVDQWTAGVPSVTRSSVGSRKKARYSEPGHTGEGKSTANPVIDLAGQDRLGSSGPSPVLLSAAIPPPGSDVVDLTGTDDEGEDKGRSSERHDE